MRAVYACIATLLVAAHAVAADPANVERARKLEDEARREFARGNHARAAELFDQANRLTPFPEFRYNIAFSWDQAGEKARAADAYESAVRLGGLDEDRAAASGSRLAVLKRELAYVRVVRPAGATVSVAHVERAPVPVEIHLPPGQHELVIELPGGRVQRQSIEASAGQTSTIAVEPEPEPIDPLPPPAAPPADPGERDRAGSSSTRTWGFVALGTGVVLGGVAAYLGLRTLDEKDQYEESGFQDRDAYDRGTTLRTWTNVALAGAIVSAGAGVTLLVIGSGSSPTEKQVGFRLRLRADRLVGDVSF